MTSTYLIPIRLYDDSPSLESGFFPNPVPSPLPDADRAALLCGWECFLRPEVRCLEQWLDFNA